jgi:hypothetical protein
MPARPNLPLPPPPPPPRRDGDGVGASVVGIVESRAATLFADDSGNARQTHAIARGLFPGT